MRKANSFRKIDSCHNKSGIAASSKASRALDEAVIWKDFAKDIVGNPDYALPKFEDLEKEVASSYSDEVIDHISETQAGYVHALSGQIFRFGRSWRHEYEWNRDEDDGSTTNGLYVATDVQVTLDLSGLVKTEFDDDDEIVVSFDAVTYDPVQKKLEGIVFKRGLPKLSQQGRAYQNVHNSIEMHLMSLALRKVAAEQYKSWKLSLGDEIEVLASFYYSKKTSDTSESTYWDNYFGGNVPIRSLAVPQWNIPASSIEKILFIEDTTNAYGGTVKSVDSELLDLLDDFAGGFEKSDMKESDDCESCPDRFICYYKLAPKHLEEEDGGKVKIRKKITPTEEQKRIINARKGIYVCNAVPGSGKTETAIKARTVDIILGELKDIEAKAEAGEDISAYLVRRNLFLTKDSRQVDADVEEEIAQNDPFAAENAKVDAEQAKA
jgi:hypothetical protein